jgi:transcriptional regulator with XRE-family HTH domain
MEEPHTKLAELITERRKQLKIRQEDLAELTGVALRTIRDMEKNTGNPSLQTIEKIMHVLGIELLFKLRK